MSLGDGAAMVVLEVGELDAVGPLKQGLHIFGQPFLIRFQG